MKKGHGLIAIVIFLLLCTVSLGAVASTNSPDLNQITSMISQYGESQFQEGYSTGHEIGYSEGYKEGYETALLTQGNTSTSYQNTVLVDQVAGVTRAVNRSTGEVISQGSDARPVIMAGIGRIGRIGKGKLFFNDSIKTEYVLSGSIYNLVPNLVIQGVDRDLTILKLADDLNCHVVYGWRVNNITIMDLTIRGNDHGQADGYYGIHLFSCDDVLIKNVRVEQITSIGIYFILGSNHIVENCLIENVGSCGVYQFKGSHATLFNNTVINSGAAALRFSTVEYGSISNNHVEYSGYDVWLKTWNTRDGIYVSGSQHIIIPKNLVNKTGRHGICVTYFTSHNITISKNTVEGAGHTPAGGGGITAESGPRNIIVLLNLVRKCYGQGMKFVSAGDDSVMDSNTCIENTHDGILLIKPKNSRIFNNTCSDNGQGKHSGNQNGIRLYKTQSAHILKNHCKNQQYGVYEDVECDYNHIEDNDLLENGLGGIYVRGENTTLINNTGSIVGPAA